ncbi:MAG: hypothetical protein ACP5IB_08630 [Thermoplasmata archaeon]
MRAIELRGKPYVFLEMAETVRQYRKISDPLSMLLLEIFEKDPNNKIPKNEVLKIIEDEAEARGFVMENLTLAKITRALKELFNATVSRTTKRVEKSKENGEKEKMIEHNDYYSGIRKKEHVANLEVAKKLDTLQEAVLDYLASFENGDRIRVSYFPLTPLIKEILNIYKESTGTLDTWIQPMISCLENSNNTLSQCVSNFQRKSEDSNPTTGTDNQEHEDNKDGRNRDDMGKTSLEAELSRVLEELECQYF